MSRFNKIILIGTVLDSPELKQTSSGDSLCSFNLDVNRPTIENAETQSDRFCINAWRDLAESAATIQKGALVIVDGSIRNRSFDNNEGQRVYVTEIEARMIKSIHNQAQADSNPSDSNTIPVIESDSPNDSASFDFNDAIKSDSSSEFVTQLGEDVPF